MPEGTWHIFYVKLLGVPGKIFYVKFLGVPGKTIGMIPICFPEDRETVDRHRAEFFIVAMSNAASCDKSHYDISTNTHMCSIVAWLL